MLYFQCSLSQGSARTQAFIPERGAGVGKLIEIKDDGFTGLWRVDQVPEKGIDEKALRDKQARDRDPFGSITKRH